MFGSCTICCGVRRRPLNRRQKTATFSLGEQRMRNAKGLFVVLLSIFWTCITVGVDLVVVVCWFFCWETVTPAKSYNFKGLCVFATVEDKNRQMFDAVAVTNFVTTTICNNAHAHLAHTHAQVGLHWRTVQLVFKKLKSTAFQLWRRLFQVTHLKEKWLPFSCMLLQG